MHPNPVKVADKQAQKILWQFTQRKALFLHPIRPEEQQRIQDLMEQYQDVPMDLTDASPNAAAEALEVRRIFTLDSNFYVYPRRGTQAFEVIP